MTTTAPFTRGLISQTEVLTIPIFSGDPNTLPVYIEACEDLIQTYARTNDPNAVNPYLSRIVKSRLAGKAQSLIGSRNLKTWIEIKRLLELSFFDQRSEDCLLNDLMTVTISKNENPYAFGEKIKDLLNLLSTKMRLDTREEQILLKTTLYKNTALQTYKLGLMKYGKIGELMYIKNPANLEDAMAEVLEYQNWQYRYGFKEAPQNHCKIYQQIIPGQMGERQLNNVPTRFYQNQTPTYKPNFANHLQQMINNPHQFRTNAFANQPNRSIMKRPQFQKPSSFKFQKIY